MSETSRHREERPQLPNFVTYDHTPSEAMIEEAFALKADGDRARAASAGPEQGSERGSGTREHREDATVLGGLKAVLAVDRVTRDERKERREQKKLRIKAVKSGLKLDKNMRRAVTNVDRRAVYAKPGEEFQLSDIPTTRKRRGYVFNEQQIRRTAAKAEARLGNKQAKAYEAVPLWAETHSTSSNSPETEQTEAQAATHEPVIPESIFTQPLELPRPARFVVGEETTDKYATEQNNDAGINSDENTDNELSTEVNTALEAPQEEAQANESSLIAEPVATGEKQEANHDTFEIKSGLDVTLLREIDEEIGESIRTNVRQTKYERDLKSVDELPRADFESIRDNTVEMVIKYKLIELGMATKEDKAALKKLFNAVRRDLRSLKSFDEQKKIEEPAPEPDAAAPKKSQADQYEELLKSVPNA